MLTSVERQLRSIQHSPFKVLLSFGPERLRRGVSLIACRAFRDSGELVFAWKVVPPSTAGANFVVAASERQPLRFRHGDTASKTRPVH